MESSDSENARLGAKEGQLEDCKLVCDYFKTFFINMKGSMILDCIA
jgi:hypothetical protein